MVCFLLIEKLNSPSPPPSPQGERELSGGFMSYNILWIDDDADFLMSMKILLKRKFKIDTLNTLAEGFQEIRKNNTDLVLLDFSLSADENGLDGLKQIKQLSPETDVIMVTGAKDPKIIVEAIRAGAADYICKPFAIDELIAIIERVQTVSNIRDRTNTLIEDMNPVDTRSRILGSSPKLRDIMEKASRLKGHNANVLILGESGTGKELLARYVHSLEENLRRPFIAVNCAAIPEGLIESELFGYERGAFTGANHRKIGKFELANGGDIFLDEISSLKPGLQAKILRVLQEKEVVRVGGNTPIPVNFRVIAATNENLGQKVNDANFRIDLYHRLRVVELQIPPLRERKEDIPLLIAYFLDKFGRSASAKKIAGSALRRLQEYPWPGNIRELENVIHSLTILSSDEIITSEHLPHWMDNPAKIITESDLGRAKEVDSLNLPTNTESVTLRDWIKEAEKIYIERALKKNNGDKTRTAKTLNMGRTTLYGKLKELDLLN